MDDNIESQTTHEVTETPHKDTMLRRCLFSISFLMISIAITACIVCSLEYYLGDSPQYSIAIDSSASVLDHNAGLSFNLTLVVASRAHAAKECIKPGMYVEVFYRGFQVAAISDPAETRRTCAKPRNVAELPVVARATMLPVGNVLESLAAEMGHGAAAFDLRLNIPTYGKTGRMSLSVSNCKASRVGQAAVPCHY